MAPQRFSATVVSGPGGPVFVPVPFDPNLVWGTKTRHHITGTVNGKRVRGLAPGDHVDVALEAEGPQRDGLARIAAMIDLLAAGIKQRPKPSRS